MSRAAWLIVVLGVFVAALAWPANAPDRGHAQGSQLRIVLPMMSRDVYPDVTVESVAFLHADAFEARFRYRLRNIGDAPADLSKFTMQAWFSADAALQKGVDAEAEIIAFSVSLAPGAVLEAEATAHNQAAPVTTHPYLVLELDSAGSVVESNPNNNVFAARRPPLDLLANVTLTWDEGARLATVSWTFNGETHGIPDAGFRIETPGFGTQEVPPATRSVTVPFNPFTGARPCIALVTALAADGPPWPSVESNRLCQ